MAIEFRFLNRSGLSLTSAMIGLAVSSIVIYVTMLAINYSLNNQRTIEVKLAANELQQEIVNVLRSQAVCSYNFGEQSKNAATFEYHPIYEPFNVSDFNQVNEKVDIPHISTKKGPAIDGTDNVYRYVKYGHVIGGTTYQQNYGGNKIRITEIALANFQPTGPGNPVEGTADLQLKMEAVGQVVGIRSYNRSIALRINLENPYNPALGATNLVKNCTALGGSGDENIWIKKADGEIHYPGGSVGVASADPTEDFEVGPVSSGTTMATIGIKSESPALRLIETESSLPLDSRKFQIQNAGGNLHFGSLLNSDNWKLSTLTEVSPDTVYGSMVLFNSGDSFFKGNMSIGNILAAPSAYSLSIAQGGRTLVGAEMVNMGGTEPGYASLGLKSYNNSGHPGVNFWRARGTYAAPETVQSGDLLGGISGWGWDGDNWGLIGGWSPVGIGFAAEADFAATNTPTRISFITSAGNEVKERMRIDRYGRVTVDAVIPETGHGTGRLAGLVVEAQDSWGGGIASKVAGAVPDGLGPRFFGYSMNGTLAVPTATLSGDGLVAIGGLGFNGTSFNTNANGFFEIEADGDFSTTSNPTRISLSTTPVSSTSAQDRLVIRSNGHVGINVTNPQQILHVNGVVRIDAPGDATLQLNSTAGTAGGAGDFWEVYEEDSSGNLGFCYVTAGSCSQKMELRQNGNLLITGTYSPSDQRLKENVSKIDRPLQILSKINGVRFQWKDSKRSSVGVIAQDVESVFPELVDENAQGFKAVNNFGLIGPIIEGIKELARRFSELSEKIAKVIENFSQLNSEVEKMKNEVNSLKVQMSQMKTENETLRKKLEIEKRAR